MKFNIVAAASGCAAMAVSAMAIAQTPPSAPTTQHGAPINNLCILSIEGAIGSSTVGQYVDTRMQQIIAQVNAELNAERTGIDNEAKTLDAQRATMDQSALEKRAADLQVRANSLQRKAQLRDREVGATEQKALGRVSQELEPLIRQVYQQKQCSVLLRRDAVVIASPAMDITPQIVTALNAKITQFAFDRERMDQPTTAASAPAPAPAPAPAAAPAARRR